MLTPKELVATDTSSAAEHSRSAAASRRLAGSLRAQLAADRIMTAKERSVVEAAAALFDRLAQVRAEAARLAKRRTDDLATRQEAIGKALRSALGTLDSVADRVAFIAAVDKHALADGARRLGRPGALAEAVEEAMETLAIVLARQPGSKAPRALAEESVTRLRSTKASVLAPHQALVDALVVKDREQRR